MRFMMVFEGIDRASRVMNKLMGAEKKMAAATKANAAASNKASDDSARTTQKQISLYSRLGSAARSGFSAVIAGANAAARATAALHRQTVNLAKMGLGQIDQGARKAFRGVVLAASVATVALGTSTLIAQKFVGTASQFEKFQTILENTEGSGDKARKSMMWVTDFAVKTPYELDQVMDSFVKLRAYGLDPTNGLLRDLGDTAAAMGKPLEQAVEAMADAVTGENERLKEFGIRAAVEGNEILYTYTVNGQKKVAKALKSDPGGIQKTISKVMRERFGGAMDKLSRTWEGMTSNLADLWVKMQLAVMNAGLFDWMKGRLQEILDTINRMAENGDLERWAKRIGETIKTVLENAWNFGQRAFEVLSKLATYLQAAADYVGGWERLAAVLATMAFAPTLIATAAGIVQIATGLAMLGTALAANPIMLAIAGIVAGAYLIYANWAPIKQFFVGVWDVMASGASAAWEKLKSILSGLNPVPLILSAWGGVKGAMSAAFDGVVAIARGAWAGLKLVIDWHPMVIIARNWSGIRQAVGGAVDRALSYLTSVWNSIKSLFDWSPIEAITQAWSGIADAVGGFIDDAAARAGAAWARVKSVFTFDDTSATAALNVTDPQTVLAAAAATEKLQKDMQAVAAIDTAPAMAKMAALDAAAKNIFTSVTSAVRRAQAFLTNVSFYDQGAALMDTMAAGMRARASVVLQEIQKLTQTIRDHLPSSPAKIGPLSDIHRLKFGETIAGSIRAEPMVRAMRAAAAATMGAAAITAPALAANTAGSPAAARAAVASASVQSGSAGGLSGPVSVHFQPTVKIDGRGKDAGDIEAAVERALAKSTRQFAAQLDEEMRRRKRREV